VSCFPGHHEVLITEMQSKCYMLFVLMNVYIIYIHIYIYIYILLKGSVVKFELTQSCQSQM